MSGLLCDEILDVVSEMNIGSVIASESGTVLKEKVRGIVLEMFLSDTLIQSIPGLMGEEIQGFISSSGKSYIQPVLDKKLEELKKSWFPAFFCLI